MQSSNGYFRNSRRKKQNARKRTGAAESARLHRDLKGEDRGPYQRPRRRLDWVTSLRKVSGAPDHTLEPRTANIRLYHSEPSFAFDKSVGSGLDMTMGHPAPSAVKSVNNGALGVSAHFSTIGLSFWYSAVYPAARRPPSKRGPRPRPNRWVQSPSASGTITKCQDQPFDG